LKRLIESRLAEIDARGVNSIPLDWDTTGDTVVRVGRYGPYLQRGGPEGERASIPEDLPPDELTPERAEELFAAPSGERVLGSDDGREITVKTGRYGPYVTDGERSSSLLASMSPETVTMDDARRLLTLPRSLGAGPDGEEITAQNGRYGPYVKRGADSRSLDSEEQLFTITLDEALALFAQPKTRARRSAAAAPLRELGADPISGKPMVVKEGRFGPYVTDGETNASLRRGDSIEELTADRAAELLADRRARGPAPTKKAGRKAPVKAAGRTTKSTAGGARKASAKKATPRKAPAAR
jgi:DNA topoisomerase I